MKQCILSILFLKIVLGSLCHAVQPYCNKSEDCQSNEYCDRRRCVKCRLCPEDVISGTNPYFYYLSGCARRNTGHCPFWCSENTNGPPSDETGNMRHQACRKKWSERTPSYSSPTVNIAADFVESTRTYNITCSVQSVPVIPYMKWYNPSGAVIKEVEFAVGDVATHNLMIANFAEDDQGVYSCEALWAEGIAAGNATIQLNYTYVPPVTTLQPAQSSSEWSVTSSNSIASHSPKDTPSPPDSSKHRPLLQPVVKAILVLAPVPVVFGIILGCWWCRKQWRDGYRPTHAEDKICLYDSITLETTDFERGSVRGLSCSSLWNGDCKAIIVERVPAGRRWRMGRCLGNSDRIWKVPNGVNEQEIPKLCWSDNIMIWRKHSSPRLKQELVKTLTMNCLQVSGSFTSLTVRCPAVVNTFYVRIGERKDEKYDWLGPAELMMSGKKEFHDLRPQFAYKIILGTRDDSASQGTNWRWSTTIETESPSFLPFGPGETTATLQLKDRLPESCRLFVTINDSKKEEELRDVGYQCKGLIPGMLQVVQLKIREGGNFRHLQEETFCTTGTIPDGGRYEGDVSTAWEEYDCQPTRKRRHKPMAPPLDTCSTGLQEGLKIIEEEGLMLSRSVDETAFEIIVSCLQHLFRVTHRGDSPHILPRASRNLETVWDVLVKWDLQDVCSIFDIMRRFAADTNFSSRRQIDLARELHGGHSRKCRLCNHALFLIERRDSSKR